MLQNFTQRTRQLKARALFIRRQYQYKYRKFLPAIFFFGGFAWDAFSLRKSAGPIDLTLLVVYVSLAALILPWLARYKLAHHHQSHSDAADALDNPESNLEEEGGWQTKAPYMLLQFIYGSLLSALFVLYFVSAGALGAIAWTLIIGGLLVANEYLEDDYKRFTLNWAMLGLCTILVFNFILPILVGSISAVWFYLSTLLGTAVVILVKRFAEHQYRASLTVINPDSITRLAPAKQCLGRIQPTLLIGLSMLIVYQLNIIPPVPLVKRDIEVGLDLKRFENRWHKTTYQIVQQKALWWQFWRKASNTVAVTAGDKIYCLSVIFAPSGLNVKLIHRWEYETKQGWKLASKTSFGLNGGRSEGFRGFTAKDNLQVGHWRVIVETETEQTVARYDFNVKRANASTAKNTIIQRF